MGYVHDTRMAQFIPPTQIGASAGTWTLAVASNIWSNNRTAADASFTLYIPVVIPSNSAALKGAQLNSIEFMYEVTTGAMDAVTSVKLWKNTLSATAASGSGTINTVAEVTAVTLDAGHNTDAERLAVDQHRLVLSLDTPVFIDNDEYYHVEVVCDAAATSVWKTYGAIINYTLRV